MGRVSKALEKSNSTRAIGEGRLVRFPLVNTDWNWFERVSALDLLSV